MEKNPEIKLVIAMLIFGSIGIFVKNIELPSTVIVLWRTIIGCIFLAGVLLVKREPMDRNGILKNIPQLVVAGIVLGGGWAFLFEAYRYATVSTATLLYYCAPIVVFLLSPFIFKEKISFSQVIGITGAIIGMLIINGTGIKDAASVLGVIYSLIAALLYATLMITNKFIKDLSGLESTFIQLLIASVVMGIYVLMTTGSLWHIPSSDDLMLVLILGIIHTGVACYLYFSSMQKLQGQTISVMSYIDPSSALIFSAIFLDERLSLLQIIGGLLILGGTAFSQLFKFNKQ
ncbi:MAG: DMT family transporter [Cellulosilyticaceae bacterium]